jgi:hypothetical protein
MPTRLIHAACPDADTDAEDDRGSPWNPSLARIRARAATLLFFLQAAATVAFLPHCCSSSPWCAPSSPHRRHADPALVRRPRRPCCDAELPRRRAAATPSPLPQRFATELRPNLRRPRLRPRHGHQEPTTSATTSSLRASAAATTSTPQQELRALAEHLAPGHDAAEHRRAAPRPRRRARAPSSAPSLDPDHTGVDIKRRDAARPRQGLHRAPRPGAHDDAAPEPPATSSSPRSDPCSRNAEQQDSDTDLAPTTTSPAATHHRMPPRRRPSPWPRARRGPHPDSSVVAATSLR